MVIRLLQLNELDKFVKPLIMPVLLYYLFRKTSGKIYKHHLLLAVAIITAWVGDILLLADETPFLLGGIMAFLITQLVYLFIFKRNTAGSFVNLLVQNKLPSAILLICYSTFLFSALQLISSDIKFAVIFYGLVVTVATWYAFTQNKLVKTQFLKIGMSLFLISDATLATNLFFTEVPLAPVLVMATYGTAQFFITDGIVTYMDRPSHS